MLSAKGTRSVSSQAQHATVSNVVSKLRMTKSHTGLRQHFPAQNKGLVSERNYQGAAGKRYLHGLHPTIPV